jgi:hypothetical protein
MSEYLGSTPPRRERSRWWPALLAAVITFTVVLTSGAVLLGVRWLDQRSEPAPPPRSPAASPGTPAPATTAATTSPAAGSDTSRLVLVDPRRVVDTRDGSPVRAGAEVPVPLPGVPQDASAVLLEVSVLDAAGRGTVVLVSDDEETPVLAVPRRGARTSATVVTRLSGGADLEVRTEGGGHLVVTLSGVFEPAAASAGGRILPVPAEEALVLVPGRDGNRGTIRPRDLDLGGLARDEVAGVLLTFQADVGRSGGSVTVRGAGDRVSREVFWGATQGEDRTRRGFLVVPSSQELQVSYHAGTRLVVRVVGVVTGTGAAQESAGLSVPVRPQALASVTVPAGGRLDIDLPEAAQATAVLTTVATTPDGGRPRATLALLDVRSGAARVTGPEGAEVVLTPRLLIR